MGLYSTADSCGLETPSWRQGSAGTATKPFPGTREWMYAQSFICPCHLFVNNIMGSRAASIKMSFGLADTSMKPFSVSTWGNVLYAQSRWVICSYQWELVNNTMGSRAVSWAKDGIHPSHGTLPQYIAWVIVIVPIPTLRRECTHSSDKVWFAHITDVLWTTKWVSDWELLNPIYWKMQEKAEKTMGYEILSESNNQQLSDFNLLCLKFGSGAKNWVGVDLAWLG